jgi:hypothetical protein
MGGSAFISPFFSHNLPKRMAKKIVRPLHFFEYHRNIFSKLTVLICFKIQTVEIRTISFEKQTF